jgi:hypothetical protein
VALAAKGATRTQVEGALSRGVANGQLLRGNSGAARDAPSLRNVGQGVVSFKFSAPPMNENAAAAVRCALTDTRGGHLWFLRA